MPSTKDSTTLLQEWDLGAWSLAALTMANGNQGSTELRKAASNLLATVGFEAAEFPGTPAQLAAMAAGPLHIASSLAAGHSFDWSQQSDQALLAQGRSSALAGPMFARHHLPSLGAFAEQFNAPGARMLDVGTGTGALALGFAEAFPNLHVLGIDILDRALTLAARTVSERGAGARVTLRRLSIADLHDADGFDLAWIPAPFIPPEALSLGVRAVANALRPGGFILLGHAKFGADVRADALDRFKTIAFGGTPVDDDGARSLLRRHGLVDIRDLPSPPGAPALTIGRRS